MTSNLPLASLLFASGLLVACSTNNSDASASDGSPETVSDAAANAIDAAANASDAATNPLVDASTGRDASPPLADAAG